MADLDGLPSVELVRAAVASPVNFKLVSLALEKRQPDAAAAEFLVAAFAGGDAPPWLTAHLLGQVRAEVGYDTARTILLAAPGALAESYAGCALARIRGLNALPDLVDILRDAPKRASREGAAYGLGTFDSAEAADAIFDASVSGQIRVPTGGGILGHMPLDQLKVTTLLASGEERLVRFGTEIVWSLATARGEDRARAAPHAPPHPSLVSAVRTLLANSRVTMAPRKREALAAWVLGNRGAA